MVFLVQLVAIWLIPFVQECYHFLNNLPAINTVLIVSFCSLDQTRTVSRKSDLIVLVPSGCCVVEQRSNGKGPTDSKLIIMRFHRVIFGLLSLKK